jgi:CheY-like chemotaxis protein
MSGPTREERRLFARARVVATATAWVRGLCKGSYIVENLSWGGAQLSGGPQIRVGDDVKLVLELPRGPVEVKGHVLRSEAQARDFAIAVRFDELSRKARDTIGVAVGEALEHATRESSVRPEPTVLVVDRSLLVREALVHDLRCFGWEAASFSTSLDALTFLERPESCIRVALVDHAAPGDGRELLSFLADERPAIRRVLLADAAHSATREPEHHAVLAKPWNRDALVLSVALSVAPAA